MIENRSITKTKIKRIDSAITKYPIDYKCYGVDDIPNEVKLKKEYVKEIIDPDILDLRQKRWNNCTSVNEKEVERSNIEKILFEVKHGFSDVKLVKLKDKVVYPGVDTRELSYFLWNNSTKLEEKDKKELYNKQKKQRKLSNLKNYELPIQRSVRIESSYREIKEETKKLRKEIKEEMKYKFPKASNELINYKVIKELEPIIQSSLNLKTGHRIHKEEKMINNKKEDIEKEGEKIGKKKQFPFQKRIWNEKKKEEEAKGRYSNNSNFKLRNKVYNLFSEIEMIKLVDLNMKFNLDKNLYEPIYRYYHSGKWGFLPSIDKKHEVWSCCLYSNFDSKGCVKEYISGGKQAS